MVMLCNRYPNQRLTDMAFFGGDTDADISVIHGPIADTDNRYFQNL